MNKNTYIIIVIAVIGATLLQTSSFIKRDNHAAIQDKNDCIKCHDNIKAQLDKSAYHTSFACGQCHPRSAINHTMEHPECDYCHDTTHLSDNLEAHSGFVPMNSQGCIACHTNYNVILNYSRPEFIVFSISNVSGNWIISNFSTIGMLNLSYNTLRAGGNHNIKNVSCRECHEDIFEAVSAKGHAIILGKDGTQVAYHNVSKSKNQEEWCLTCHNTHDNKFPSHQHAARRTGCEDCHETYNLSAHPGNLYNTIKTVPRLYRGLVCISCKSIGWQAPNTTLKFRVHQEPYFDVTMW